MTGQTNVFGTVVPAPTTGDTVFGPYLQQTPANPLNGKTDVAVSDSDSTPGTANTGGAVGFLMNKTTGKIWGTSAQTGFVYNEANPSDPNNEQ
jgi:hypothetical protein